MTLTEPTMLSSLIEYFSTLPMLEWVAMLLSLAYIILATRGSLWCWPAAFISTALYTYIFYDVLLLMDSALNAYYLVMAMYGYWAWKKADTHNMVNASRGKLSQSNGLDFTVISWNTMCHLKFCAILAIISLLWGGIMANYTSADFPYLDTFTTVYAVFATYLVTQKVLENWLYWLVIDAVSIYLYINKGLYPTALLFIIFVVIACYGYFKWLAIFKNNTDSNIDNDNTGRSFT